MLVSLVGFLYPHSMRGGVFHPVKRNCVQGTDVSSQQIGRLAYPQVHIHCILNELTDF